MGNEHIVIIRKDQARRYTEGKEGLWKRAASTRVREDHTAALVEEQRAG